MWNRIAEAETMGSLQYSLKNRYRSLNSSNLVQSTIHTRTINWTSAMESHIREECLKILGESSRFDINGLHRYQTSGPKYFSSKKRSWKLGYSRIILRRVAQAGRLFLRDTRRYYIGDCLKQTGYGLNPMEPRQEHWFFWKWISVPGRNHSDNTCSWSDSENLSTPFENSC